MAQPSFFVPSDQMSKATTSTLGPSAPTVLRMPSFGGACFTSAPVVVSMLRSVVSFVPLTELV